MKLRILLGVAVAVFLVGYILMQNTEASKQKRIEQQTLSFKAIRAMLAQSDDQIDLALARLHIEKILDPKIDIQANLKHIDAIVTEIKKVPRYEDNTEGKLNAIIQYLYISGKWNDEKPYHYDFDDPLGTTKPENSLISNYMETRMGNCVSMPILVLILGKKLGLDMSLSKAPLHFFVRLKNEGKFFNFEATAGGLKANSSYIRDFQITKDAVKNGVYLQNLTNKKAIAGMLVDVGRMHLHNNEFEQAQDIGDLILRYDSRAVSAMHLKGNAWHGLLMRELDTAKKKREKLTLEHHRRFESLLAKNLKWFEKSEKLGWRQPAKDYDTRYKRMVKEVRKQYE